MRAGPALALKPPVRLVEDPLGLEELGRKRLGLPGAQRAFLRALSQGGGTEEDLCGPPGSPGARERRYLLALLEKEGWLSYALAWDGRTLATLEPLTRAFRYRPVPGDGAWRLSRFAWLRRHETDGLVLESPLGLGRVRLQAPGMLALVGLLDQPRTAEALAESSGLPPTQVRIGLSLLAAAAVAAPCPDGGPLAEDQDPSLRPWEFHDLLFHSRSRRGRHGEPVGGTYRFRNDLPPLPALKPLGSGPGIPLPEPTLPGADPPFFATLEARRSIRVPRGEPITFAQLGTFLHHVARIRAVAPPDPGAGRLYETVSGPCPGGGALHELELYLTITRCAGLAPGFYHYAAGAHRLEPWPAPGEASGDLLRQAREALGPVPAPDLVITLAARMQRVAWKYQTIAYALILKNTGVLFQQMYLVATALGLAPCALGVGDTEAFAAASGLAFTQESSVGEFALSG